MCRAEAYLVDLQSNDSDGGDVGHQKRQAPVTRPEIGSPVQMKYGAEGKIKKTNENTNTKCSKSNSGRLAAAWAKYGAKEARDKYKYTKTKTKWNIGGLADMVQKQMHIQNNKTTNTNWGVGLMSSAFCKCKQDNLQIQ